MRSCYGPGRLLLASKKPKIQKLIKDLETMSIDQIKQLNEKPDIIKGLIEIKTFGSKKATISELIADKMQGNALPTSINKLSPIYQYTGNPRWLKTRSSEILLEPHWHWHLLSTNQLYVSSNFINLDDVIVDELKADSVYIKLGSIDDLMSLEKDRIYKLL